MMMPDYDEMGIVLLTAQPDLFDYLAIINQIK